MPTDALTVLRDVMLETEQYGFDKSLRRTARTGPPRAPAGIAAASAIAAEGFQAWRGGQLHQRPGDSNRQEIPRRRPANHAAGVPLPMRRKPTSTPSASGLFGLDKLHDPARTVESLAENLDKVLG